MLSDKFEKYVLLEKNYMVYREDYHKICELHGVGSDSAVKMYEFLQSKMRELVDLNEEILDARISYFECEEGSDSEQN